MSEQTGEKKMRLVGGLVSEEALELLKNEPLLRSVRPIKPRELRHIKFGGLRTEKDTNGQDAGGDGVDGVDHGD